MKLGCSSRVALALISASLGLAFWLEGADARRDQRLLEELAAAPFARFDASFYLGAPGDGRIRILPLEERTALLATDELVLANAAKREELLSYLRVLEPGPMGGPLGRAADDAADDDGDDDADDDGNDEAERRAAVFNEAAGLARLEHNLARRDPSISSAHRDAARGLLTPDGRALFDEWLDDVAASKAVVIDRRDEIFARHIVETTRQLALSHEHGRFSVVVFVGTGHVPGVVRRVREALGIDVDHEPVDFDEILKQAMGALDRTSDVSLRTQAMEFANAHAVAVDIGPVRILGDTHSPYLQFGLLQLELGQESKLSDGVVAGFVAVVEKELPNSIARYAAVVEEVRDAALQGQQIVFFAEFDAIRLVDSLAYIRNAGLFEAFKTALASHVSRRGEANEQLDLEAEAARLFPFFYMGPAGLFIAKLDERDVPTPFLQPSEL